jgi:hypothetical protein
VDCGVDTTPCTGKRGCRHIGRWEHYMVHPEVWRAAGMQPPTIKQYNETDGDFLCIGCLEARLGRTLTPDYFIAAPINNPDDSWKTPRLRDRLTNGRK